MRKKIGVIVTLLTLFTIASCDENEDTKNNENIERVTYTLDYDDTGSVTFGSGIVNAHVYCHQILGAVNVQLTTNDITGTNTTSFNLDEDDLDRRTTLLLTDDNRNVTTLSCSNEEYLDLSESTNYEVHASFDQDSLYKLINGRYKNVYGTTKTLELSNVEDISYSLSVVFEN